MGLVGLGLGGVAVGLGVALGLGEVVLVPVVVVPDVVPVVVVSEGEVEVGLLVLELVPVAVGAPVAPPGLVGAQADRAKTPATRIAAAFDTRLVMISFLIPAGRISTPHPLRRMR